MIVKTNFFNKNSVELAQSLIGKMIYRKYNHLDLRAIIIETEAYELNDEASHASLGYSPKIKALYMTPGTIYMHFAHGQASFGIHSRKNGGAVLIKSARIYPDDLDNSNVIETMQSLSLLCGGKKRSTDKLLTGQTILCKSLDLKVKDWSQKQFNNTFNIQNIDYEPQKIIATTRVGIPPNRDNGLLNRFIDYKYVRQSSKNPLTTRKKTNFILEDHWHD
ncbi:DNA-3-methyladenine glycosylase [Paraphotobacterium marinum]